MKKYEFFDVTADIGIIGYGNDLNEAFENAGLAMFNVITDTCDVSSSKEISFEIASEDYVSLLYDYLEELLFYHETEFMLFGEFHVKIDENLRLCATVRGEGIDWEKHERKTEIKAITFHKMEVNLATPVNVRAILDL